MNKQHSVVNIHTATAWKYIRACTGCRCIPRMKDCTPCPFQQPRLREESRPLFLRKSGHSFFKALEPIRQIHNSRSLFHLPHHFHISQFVEPIKVFYLFRGIVFQKQQHFLCKFQTARAVCSHDAPVCHSLFVNISGGIGIVVTAPQLQLLQAVARMPYGIKETVTGKERRGIADGSNNQSLCRPPLRQASRSRR